MSSEPRDVAMPTLLTISYPEVSRQVALGEHVVVYADEQGSSNPDAGTDFAVGYAFEPEPVMSRVVTTALASGTPNLRAVGRGYFHASQDCSPSRDLMASALTKDPGDVFFSSLRWSFDRARQGQPTKGALHRHALALVLNGLTQRKGVRRVELRFARCQGLSEESLEKWFEEDVDVRLRLLETLPGLPMYFPAFAARQVEPTNPGVQVADHLLWRERRYPERGGDALEDVGLSLSYQNATDNAFVIRHYVRRETAIAQVPHRPLPRAAPGLPRGEWMGLMVEMERFVHRQAARRPLALEHLQRIMLAASDQTRGIVAISPDNVDQLCRAFLVAVDTLPGYDVDEPGQAQAASDAASLAANILRKRESWSVTLLDRWLDTRPMVIRDGKAAEYLFGGEAPAGGQ